MQFRSMNLQNALKKSFHIPTFIDLLIILLFVIIPDQRVDLQNAEKNEKA